MGGGIPQDPGTEPGAAVDKQGESREKSWLTATSPRWQLSGFTREVEEGSDANLLDYFCNFSVNLKLVQN